MQCYRLTRCIKRKERYMNLVEVMDLFPDQETCISFLEHIRWGDNPVCVHCGGDHITKRKETATGRIGRWNCNSCKVSFKVTQGTVFHGTKIPLQKWFLAIALMMNAKKSLSSCQLARDLDIKQKAAWFMMTRIRAEMANKTDPLLSGIIEADETYIGGKPRKRNKREDDKPVKRGRGTSKQAIIGAVERGGKVVAQLATDLTGRSILKFIQRYVSMEQSELITDEFQAYNVVGRQMRHAVIHHKEQYADDYIHTNTIEGFWSLLKRAWYGSHHHYSVAYTPLYVSEACYKYNYRKDIQVFWRFLFEAVGWKTA